MAGQEDRSEMTQEEADGLNEHLQKIADRWRARLADPAVQQQIKAGAIRVNPLVQQLLVAFPPKESPPKSGK